MTLVGERDGDQMEPRRKQLRWLIVCQLFTAILSTPHAYGQIVLGNPLTLNARDVGAIAFGVYSEENNRYHMNSDKRERLVRAGAHFLAPDLRQGAAVLDYLTRNA